MKGNEGPKGQKLENGAGPGAAKFFIWDIGKTAHKLASTRPTCKMKAQKAKMKGNEGPQGQNARK